MLIQQHPLINKLSRCNSLDTNFTKLLEQICQEVQTNPVENVCVCISKYLIEKIARMSKVHMKEKSVKTKKNVMKTIKEYAADLILEILVLISRHSTDTATFRVVEIFLNHIERHPTCTDTLAILYKWLHFSPPTLKLFREKFVSATITIFERRVREVVRKLNDPAKREEVWGIYKKSITETQTFQDNLDDYLRRAFPMVLSSDRMGDQILEDEINGYPKGTGNRNSSEHRRSHEMTLDNSFQEAHATVSNNTSGPNKKVLVPMLNLPQSQHKESNPMIISRSTRRDEMNNRSSVSVSNRVSKPLSSGGIGGSRPETLNPSREPSMRDRKRSGRQEANLSYLDDAGEPSPTGKLTEIADLNKVTTAKEQLENLAKKMGEYFLSNDLGCLVENKRKNQLDEVAKLTGIKDEIKVLESIMLDSRAKRDRLAEWSQSKQLGVSF